MYSVLGLENVVVFFNIFYKDMEGGGKAESLSHEIDFENYITFECIFFSLDVKSLGKWHTAHSHMRQLYYSSSITRK